MPKDFEIQKGIPMPVCHYDRIREQFKLMKVGDSFFMPHIRSKGSFVNIHGIAKKFGIKLKTKTKGKKTCVWRVK